MARKELIKAMEPRNLWVTQCISKCAKKYPESFNTPNVLKYDTLTQCQKTCLRTKQKRKHAKGKLQRLQFR